MLFFLNGNKQLNEIAQTERKNGNVLLRQLHVCLALSSPASRRIPSLRARARSLERANKLASERARARGCPSSAVLSFVMCLRLRERRARARPAERTRRIPKQPLPSNRRPAFLLPDSPLFPHSVSHTSAFLKRRHTFWLITGAFVILWRTFLIHWELTYIWGSCGCAVLERSGDGIADNMPFFWDIAMQFGGSRLHHSHR